MGELEEKESTKKTSKSESNTKQTLKEWVNEHVAKAKAEGINMVRNPNPRARVILNPPEHLVEKHRK